MGSVEGTYASRRFRDMDVYFLCQHDHGGLGILADFLGHGRGVHLFLSCEVLAGGEPCLVRFNGLLGATK